MIDARDSQTYTIVTIGTQTWMAENLNYYTTTFSKYWNNDSIEYAEDYGRLYDQAMADSVCPSGYHLPTDAEWKTLEGYLGMSSADQAKEGYRTSGDVGYDLKSGYSTITSYGNAYWRGQGFGSDDYNFTALPAGFVRGFSFFGLSNNAYFWTSTVDSDMASKFYFRSLAAGYDGITRDTQSGSVYMSVRCIED